MSQLRKYFKFPRSFRPHRLQEDNSAPTPLPSPAPRLSSTCLRAARYGRSPDNPMHRSQSTGHYPGTESNANDAPPLPPLSHASYAQPHIHHFYVTSLVPLGLCKAIEVSGGGWSGGRDLARGPSLKGEIGVRVVEDRHPITTADRRSLASKRSNGADPHRARIPLVRQAGARSVGGRSIPTLPDLSLGRG